MFIKGGNFYKIAKSTERILINLYESKCECFIGTLRSRKQQKKWGGKLQVILK